MSIENDDKDTELETTEATAQEAAPRDGQESEKFEFSERELAIARGEDPDELHSETESAATETGSEPTEQGEQATDGSTATGKDAAAQPAVQAKPGDWITDEVAELAEGYLVSREELAQYSSLDEFRKVAQLIDRAAITSLAGNKPAGSAGSSAKTEPTQAEVAAAKLEKLDRELYVKEGYSEKELAIIDAHNQAVERYEQMEKQLAEQSEKFEAWQKTQQERSEQQGLDAFHDSVDTMEDWLFGRSLDATGMAVQLTPDQHRNRELLFHAEPIVRQMFEKALAEKKIAGLPSQKAILQRAKHMVFHQLIADREKADLQKKISDQSRRRRPASTRPVRPSGAVARTKSGPKSDDELAAEVANDPDVVSAWAKLQEENGSQ